jgi:hypothetical protein
MGYKEGPASTARKWPLVISEILVVFLVGIKVIFTHEGYYFSNRAIDKGILHISIGKVVAFMSEDYFDSYKENDKNFADDATASDESGCRKDTSGHFRAVEAGPSLYPIGFSFFRARLARSSTRLRAMMSGLIGLGKS